MKGVSMKAVWATRVAPLGAFLVLFSAAACGGGGSNPTAPSSVPLAFGTTDLTAGSGAPVTEGQPVTVAVTVWGYDASGPDGKGAVLDQRTLDLIHGDTSFPEGWTMGLEGMQVGGSRRVVVPPGFGFNGPVVIEFQLLAASPALDVPFGTTELLVGTGTSAVAGQTLTVAYIGWIYDPNAADNKGVMFDQGADFSFVLGSNDVIPGWNQGVVGMQPNGLRRIVIPPALAYGGNPLENVPAFSTLIFEVLVLAIQ
jgi:FKBP-type peptidyl-prolyl cis-trans isomerase 2